MPADWNPQPGRWAQGIDSMREQTQFGERDLGPHSASSFASQTHPSTLPGPSLGRSFVPEAVLPTIPTFNKPELARKHRFDEHTPEIDRDTRRCGH